ncbi:VOC family protein [Ramlibacter sp.]|uniref:VOC family protein n=1 Tax=Ramlibacter sp. TaxID=1917967 RepID=UPI0035B098E8
MPMLDSYIFFDGTCADAMRFYQRVLGGEMTAMMKYSESPDPDHCPPGSADRIMHASLLVDGRTLMASDSPAVQHQPMQGFALSAFYDSPDDARKVFAQLAEGGQVMMPMGPTFWAQAFGMATDRYGTPWMVSGGMLQPG